MIIQVINLILINDINNNSSSYDDINNKFNSSNYNNCNGLIRK